MRGAQNHGVKHDQKTGIIPADAGSTQNLAVRFDHPKDHPRGCGEHWITPSRTFRPSGSSPRMRGARVHADDVTDENRIIPADAGSTLKDHCNPNTMIDKISDFK